MVKVADGLMALGVGRVAVTSRCWPFHLFCYLDEENIRFNEREGRDGTRFMKVAGALGGKRVTYKKLTGKVQDQRSTSNGGNGSSRT